MPRSPREQIPGEIYHVVTHAVASTNFVRRDSDRRQFLAELATVVDRCHWTCLAVALLDNHYHLLIRLSEPNLSRGMQRLNGDYAASFNIRYGRKGHLFGARFWNGRILGTAHFLTTLRYIALNRTAAAAAKDPMSDRWSSYPGVVGKAPCWSFIARAELLELVGPDAIAVPILEELIEGGGTGGPLPAGVRPR